MQNSTSPSPPPPPAVAQVTVNGVPIAQSPTAILKGAEAARRVLGTQLEGLQNQRSNLSDKLQEPLVRGADRQGLESHITEIDGRISAVEKQIAAADAEVAKAAGVPGAYVEPPRFESQGPPQVVYVLTGIFFVVVLMPLSIAFARRIWRRGVVAVSTLPQEVMDRLSRLDQAVDSIAVEVERIGEGQRFMTRLFADKGTPEALLASAQQRSSQGALPDRSPR
jgi:hypothetical protein